jgi:hypothetical protein
MKDEENPSGNKTIQVNQQDWSAWLEELKQSHYILKALVATLPIKTRNEFVELLQTLAKDGESQESSSFARQKALQILAEVCRQDQPQKEVEQYEPERRASERRQRDRRQQTRNFGTPWTTEQIRILQTLAEQNIPIRRIALKLGRTSTAVQSKAKEINLPLHSIEQKTESG